MHAPNNRVATIIQQISYELNTGLFHPSTLNHSPSATSARPQSGKRHGEKIPNIRSRGFPLGFQPTHT